MTQQHIYNISVDHIKYNDYVWYFATCDEMPTFMAHGPTIDILRDRVESIVIRLLTKRGITVESSQVMPRDAGLIPTNIAVLSPT